MRKKIVAGNWKMNTTPAQGLKLANEVNDMAASAPTDVELIIAPPLTHIPLITQALAKSRVKVSAQNCAAWEKGAYTGEVSAEMISSTGATHVIVGHSERREYFSENNEMLLNKIKIAMQNGLTPIFCCGEKLNERDSNQYFNVIEKQISEVLFKLDAKEMGNIIIAYEPIWAIGTGKTASPEQAQEIHAFIRQIVSKKFGDELAKSTSILYGGSCKPDNAKEIFAKADVDGGLIGGAALKAEDFIAIAKSFPK
ncbi:MAG: triose-phosphate isomerase [Bacteroidales bacterium]|nr:triose-phosphate isomerase [Bacteroidales bacterium]